MVVEAVVPEQLCRFWSAVLHQLQAAVGSEVAVNLCDDVRLVFVPTESAKSSKNRLHLDLASTSVAHQTAIVERACSFGAQQVDIGQGAVPWVVLADPQGNEFCVLEPRDEYMGIGAVAAVVIDTLNPVDLARFWSSLTGLPITRAHLEYASLRRRNGFWLEFVRVPEPKSMKNRLHLHLATGPSVDLLHEVDRLVDGAARSGVNTCQLNVAPSTELLDPERNEFCLSRF